MLNQKLLKNKKVWLAIGLLLALVLWPINIHDPDRGIYTPLGALLMFFVGEYLLGMLLQYSIISWVVIALFVLWVLWWLYAPRINGAKNNIVRWLDKNKT